MAWLNSGSVEGRISNALRLAELYFAWNERRSILGLSALNLTTPNGATAYPTPADMDGYRCDSLADDIATLRSDIESVCDSGKFYDSSLNAHSFVSAAKATGITGWVKLGRLNNPSVWTEFYSLLAELYRYYSASYMTSLHARPYVDYSDYYASKQDAWDNRHEFTAVGWEVSGLNAYWYIYQPAQWRAQVRSWKEYGAPIPAHNGQSLIKSIRRYTFYNNTGIDVNFSDDGETITIPNGTDGVVTFESSTWWPSTNVWRITVSTSEPATAPSGVLSQGEGNLLRNPRFYFDLRPRMTYG